VVFHQSHGPHKDPCEQAERNRRALNDWLDSDPRTRGIPVALFPAVAVPDSRVAGHIRPDCPQDIFIDMTHLDDLEGRLLQVFRYWQSHADARNAQMGGQRAVDALVSMLVPTRSLQPRIVELFAQENRTIEELTRQQFKILNIMRYQKRAAIIGGAGTGKTLLAMEKAMQLAQAGKRVLFLCFNKNLSDWVDHRLNHENVLVSTYHGMVGRTRHWAGLSGGGQRMGWDEFMEQAPDIMLEALDVIRAPGGDAEQYLFDALIVDEAQDFEDAWWIPIPDLLLNSENGVFYVFFDDNQRIFTQISNVPMDSAPLYLDENLRNTQHIHERLKPYSRDADMRCVGPDGRPVEIIAAADAKAQRRELQRVLHRLVNEEGIPTEEIIVLTPASEKRSQWKTDDQLGNFIITWNLDTEMQMAARVCTIYSYKGLESPVVILTELHALHHDIRDQLLYVGLSRARHHAVVIGDLPVAESL
jgi:superfamily I DNA/RNA helicase